MTFTAFKVRHFDKVLDNGFVHCLVQYEHHGWNSTGDRPLTPVLKIRKNIYRSKLFLSFSVISYVYRSFIRNKTTFTKHCLTQWLSKLWNPLSKAVPDKCNGFGRHGKHKVYNTRFTRSSQFSHVSGMANCPNFQHFDSIARWRGDRNLVKCNLVLGWPSDVLMDQ